ncbi:MAG TPA: Gfo/Idh/MocA family oxidoreductase [Thermoplasmataceae archaeon]|nr:Gfo/Idh/MocA family oxidoreductase [Thermoplasmataceae archaeon]
MDFGIIGLGNHAMNRVMPAIKESGNRITAVYSRSMDKAGREAEKYNAKAFSDLPKMFKSGDFEAVYIASPNFLHFEHAKMALEHGKHVLLEKPMTLRNEDAASLVRMSKTLNLKLCVGFHMRFNPAVLEARRLVQSGALGDIVFASGIWAGSSSQSAYTGDRKWWSEEEKVGGGSVMGTGVHVLDTLNFILNRHPESVSALRNPEKSVIDMTSGMLLSYGFTIAAAVSSRGVNDPRNDLVLLGTRATVTVNGLFSTSVNCTLQQSGSQPKTFSGGNVYSSEITGFTEAVSGKQAHIATGEDGEVVVKIVNAAFKSEMTGERQPID